jgi:hypothetical protein
MITLLSLHGWTGRSLDSTMRDTRIVFSLFGPRRGAVSALSLAAVAVLAACSEPDAIGPAGSRITVDVMGLRPLDVQREGRYRVWILDGNNVAHDAGILAPDAAGHAEFTSPISGGVALEITIDPPAGRAASARLILLRGSFGGGRATLSVRGALTRANLLLREHPGQFTMFTPSNNFSGGYPSHEDAGIWLFNVFPRETEQNDTWVRLSPLAEGWVYEGWMVRDIDTSSAIWLSYGKFVTDAAGAVNTRDDTGWGAFSGVTNYRTAGEEDFPGDDWISNPLNLPWPSALALPLHLREKTSDGRLRWTHVITIEPAWDRGEPIMSEAPFLVQPYRDSFGDAAPGMPRVITYHTERVPAGTARVQ